MLINYITGAPMFLIGVSLFAALSAFPGGSFPLAALLTFPLAMSVVYSFGLMTAAMPRTGGDYVLVSRILHPAAGIVSSVCMSFSTFLSIAFEGIAFTTLGLAPSLTVVGLISGNHTLFNWGNTISSSHTWQFVLGGACIVSSLVIISSGWRWMKRIIIGLLAFSLLGLVFSAIVALFTSQATFISHFNSFAQPYTHSSHTYGGILASAQKHGVALHPAFSFSNTIPIVGVFAGTSIYAYWSTFFAGEMRQAGTGKTMSRMGLAAAMILVSAAIFSLIFFSGWGKGFMSALFGGGNVPASLGTAPPSYFYLTSAQFGSTLVALLLCVSFLVFFPIWMAQTVLQPPRTFFAWAFDGIAPKVITKVSDRGVPTVATIVTAVLTLACYAWAIYIAKNLFQVIVYATLIQLVAHTLVGISAIAFPFRRPAFYRGSVSNRSFLGVPVTVFAGIGALFTTAFLYFCYFHWSFFGLANRGSFFIWLGGCILVGVLWYVGAVAIRRRAGIDVSRVYGEIPPE